MARRTAIVSALLLSFAIAGCERGDASRESCDPSDPSSCADGWSCRAGVCLRFSTPVEPPVDPTPPAPPPSTPLDAAVADAADHADAASSSAIDGGAR